MDNSSMSKSTTYNKTFIKHQPCANIVKKKHEYKVPTIVMDGKSTYGNEYVWKDGKRADSFMPENAYVKSRTPFCNETVYGKNYAGPDIQDWSWCRAQPFRHKECILKSDEKFATATTMKNDFVLHENVERVQPAKPNQGPSSRGSKLDSSTSYKLEFTPKTAPRVSGKRPIEYRPNSTPFEGTTTAKNDYQQHPYQKRRPSFKPDLRYKPCDSPMETKTTIMESYQEWPIEKNEIPIWARQKVYTAPEQSFEKKSFYQESYKQPVDVVRTKAARPQQRGLELTGDGSGRNVKQTHYQEQFVPYGRVDKPPTFKKTQLYMPPTESMMTETDYRTNYKGEASERAKPCTPGRKDSGARAPFDFGTTYNAVYTGLTPPDCPANDLAETVKDSEKQLTKTIGKYTRQGVTDGHHFFTKAERVPEAEMFEEPPCTCKPVVECAC